MLFETAKVTTDLIYEWDIHTNFLEWFGNMDEVLGYKPSEIPRTIDAWIKLIHPDDREKFSDSVERRRKSTKPVKEEYRVQKKDGTWVFWSDKGAPILDNSGKPVKWISGCDDITERKLVEAELKERVKELDCFYRISESIRTKDTIEDIIQDIVNIIPPTWQYPELTCAKITFLDKEFKTDNYVESKWKLSSDIIVKRKIAGKVEVCCLEQKNQNDKDPFLKEEKNLLNSITERLGRIIERKQAEEELHKSEESYHTLVETIQEGIGKIDINETFIFVNQAAADIFGYSKEEMIGKNLKELTTPEMFQKALEGTSLRKQGISNQYELEILRKNGEQRYIRVIASPMYSKKGKHQGSFGIFHDITERMQIEEDLKVSRDQYQLLFNQIADPIVIFDQETKMFIDCNTAMIDKYGYTLDELIKMIPFELHPADEDMKRVKRNIDDKEKILPNEYIHKGKDGTMYNVEIHTQEIFYKGREAWISIIRDITERKQAEEAIHQKNLQLQEHNKELDAFSHTVAHDLKNPIGVIMGFADILFEGYSEISKDDILNYLSIIIKEGNKTQQIINSLLLFASLRKAEIKTGELNMGYIVSELINRLTPMIEESNAEIKLPETWPTALGYAPWVEQVWMNYLSNAIKYGGTSPHIEIGADTDKAENTPEGMLRFWIRDNGPGISTENQKLLFKQFERLDQVKTEGHGLGLSIVRSIIEKLGGQVGLESEQGKGSLFYFTLPYYKPEKN